MGKQRKITSKANGVAVAIMCCLNRPQNATAVLALLALDTPRCLFEGNNAAKMAKPTMNPTKAIGVTTSSNSKS